MLGPITKWIRRLYDWVIGWADSPYSSWVLFIIAFAESSFFPIPPDILLIALAVAIPLRAFRYAIICSVGSVLGGAFGYLIGYQFFDVIGEPIVRFYAVEGQYQQIQEWYQRYDAYAVALAGLTPIPYKVATITAGFFRRPLRPVHPGFSRQQIGPIPADRRSYPRLWAADTFVHRKIL